MAFSTQVARDPDLDSKRQLIIASLLRFTPESASLRDRILDQLVLGGLLGSSPTHPYHVGESQSNILFGPTSQHFRAERISETLNRLGEQGKVKTLPKDKKNAYY